MILLHVTYKLKNSAERGAFLDTLEKAEVMKKTRAESASARYEFLLPTEHKDEVFLLEMWKDKEGQAAHKTTPQFFALQEAKSRYIRETSFDSFII